MRKRILQWAAVVIALGGIYAWAYVAVQPTGSDEGQIRGAVLDATEAMNEGHAGDAMSIVSPDYKDSTGLDRQRLNILARRAAYNHREWSAAVQHIAVSVQGSEALVSLTLRITGANGGHDRDTQLGLSMRREPVHIIGILPTERWRVTSVNGLPEDVLDLGD